MKREVTELKWRLMSGLHADTNGVKTVCPSTVHGVPSSSGHSVGMPCEAQFGWRLTVLMFFSCFQGHSSRTESTAFEGCAPHNLLPGWAGEV